MAKRPRSRLITDRIEHIPAPTDVSPQSDAPPNAPGKKNPKTSEGDLGKLTRLKEPAEDPVYASIKQRLAVDALAWTNREQLQSMAEDLVARRQSIEDVLLTFTRAASSSVSAVRDEAVQLTERDAAAGKMYRDSLVKRRFESRPSRARRSRKAEYVLSGTVTHPATGEPVAGMVVEARPNDAPAHDALGVGVTDRSGRFEIAVSKKALEARPGIEPKVELHAGLTRRKMAPIASEPVLLQAGERVDVEVALPQALAQATSALDTRRESLDRRRIAKAGETLALRQVQEQVIDRMASEIGRSLGAFAQTLERRLGRSG